MRLEIPVGERTMVLETGKLARQAGGAVLTRLEDTVVLATATRSAQPRPGVDFLPLSVDIEERTDSALRREFIDRLFARHLTPRERKILSLYYGLEEGSEALTLEKIGELLGVTRERIRQIRERVFEKLRASPDVQLLQGVSGAA